MKSCLDGYLTDACKTCDMWKDGSTDEGLGCGTHYPIDFCPDFKKAYEKLTRGTKEWYIQL